MAYNDISKSPAKNFEEKAIFDKNVVLYEDAFKRKTLQLEGKKFNILGIDKKLEMEFVQALKEGFNILTDKDNLDYYSNDIKECFETSCHILYDRQILKEVIDKQKTYEIDYVVDFFIYVLKMFIKRHNTSLILSKGQCTDIKDLCKKILKINDMTYDFEKFINTSSSRDIIEYLKVVIE